MKKIILSILLISFYCNNSFASPSGEGLTSFQEKLKKMSEIMATGSLNPNQSSFVMNNLTKDYTNCAPSMRGSGFNCTTKNQFCVIDQNISGTSIKCIDESDLDQFLNIT